MIAEEWFAQNQRPVPDKRAVTKYWTALAEGDEELPKDFEELTAALDEAMRQRTLFRAIFRTWDFAHEMRVFELLCARDAVTMREVTRYS